MESLTLNADNREVVGKKTRFLRRQGITPAHLFGHGLDSIALQCDTAKLQKILARAGTTRLIALEIEGDKQPRSVFIREIQKEVCTGELLHVDFYQVRKTEKIKADIPILLVGEAPALKEKGRSLIHGITSLSIECLPDKIPPQIEIDLSPLVEVEQTIHVKDIKLSPDIIVSTELDQIVVKVSEAHTIVEEEVAEVDTEALSEEEPEQKPAE
ncbi:50S ribosomal protein L25 [Chloroflexota bacterium]